MPDTIPLRRDFLWRCHRYGDSPSLQASTSPARIGAGFKLTARSEPSLQWLY